MTATSVVGNRFMSVVGNKFIVDVVLSPFSLDFVLDTDSEVGSLTVNVLLTTKEVVTVSFLSMALLSIFDNPHSSATILIL